MGYHKYWCLQTETHAKPHCVATYSFSPCWAFINIYYLSLALACHVTWYNYWFSTGCMFCLYVFVTVFSLGPSPSLPVCLSVCRCSRMQNMLPLCGLQPLLALLLLQTVGWGESLFKCGQSASPHSAVVLKPSTRSALLSSRCCHFECANAPRQPDTLLPGGCSHYCSISSINGKVCFYY